MKIIFVLLILSCSSISYGFNYRKCRQFQLKHSSFFYGPTTSMQFTSSTGACSALASRSEEKKRFFVINYEKFQNEVAQGGGEHLYTFGLLSGCSSSEQSELNILLKKNYHLIFSPNYHEKSFRELNNYATALCQG